MRKGLEVAIPPGLGRAGNVELLNVNVSSYDSPFAIVNYAMDGKKQELGLRFDLDKQVFLDKTGDPRVDDDLQNRAADVVDLVSRKSLSSAKILTVALIDSRSVSREGLMRLLDGSDRLRVIPLSRCSELLGKGVEVLSLVDIILLNLGSAVTQDPEVVKDIALLKEAVPNASIIVICDRDDSHHVGDALRHGIRGYIPTTLTSQILMGALRLVQAGGTFVPAGALTEALSHQQPTALEAAKAEVAALDRCDLTPRQREVLNLLRQGKPNKIIAHELDMRESTVKVHVRHIMRKMRVSNRTEAILAPLQKSGRVA